MKTKFLGTENPLEHSLRRLSANEVRTLVKELPEPISAWKNSINVFRVYRVKSIIDPTWKNDALYELLLSMRSSYYVYGERPPLDYFDSKSAIYAVRVNYPYKPDLGKDSPTMEEWLSIRLVPGIGMPIGAAELDFFRYEGKLVSDIVQKSLCRPDESYTEIFPGCSRMCGIEPHFIQEKDMPPGTILSSRHKHSAICYALMSLHMLEDDLKHTPARYITGVIINRFVESTLTIEVAGNKFPIAFTPAHKILNVEDPRLIKLDRRSRNLYAYHYPSYFFDAYQLLDFLKWMIDEGKITQDTLHYYFGEDFDVETALKEKGMVLVKRLKYLWKLLTAQGDVVGSKLTGEELRNLVDERVPDGPELKITPLEELEKSVETMLRAARINQIQ